METKSPQSHTMSFNMRQSESADGESAAQLKEKKIQGNIKYYRELALGQRQPVGSQIVPGQKWSKASIGVKSRPHLSHAPGITGESKFLAPEKVDTRWFVVDNSVRKNKWKAYYDEGEVPEGYYEEQEALEEERAREREQASYERSNILYEPEGNWYTD